MNRPKFFTVEEAADVLRIGRTAAYAGAQRWRATGGAEGIKVIIAGGLLRVPGPWLEELAGGPIDLEELRAQRAASKTASPPAKRTTPTHPRQTKPRRARPAADRVDQHSLPFTD